MLRTTRAWWAGLGLALVMCACGGTSADRTPTTTPDSGVFDVGPPTCQCVDVAAAIANADLCDCPSIQFGCEDAPQTFERRCDIAAPCWSVAVDVETGCPMPVVDTDLGRTDCACF